MTDETVLPGGRTQPVVRVGDTVRRRPGANSAFVSELLLKLEAARFDGVPRWLGTDQDGREVLSYVPGEVPLELGHFEAPVFTAAARFIRRFHDVTEPFCADGKVICHNDLSPCNFAFRDGLPAAVIDFDTAAEGQRLSDLGYAAWTWLDFGNEDDYSAREQAARLKAFAEAYGQEIDPAALLQAMLLRQILLAEDFAEKGDEGGQAWARWSHAATLKVRDLL
jgi:Ser/Thr protein kinase RdoA (MazF antagonist)